jgi:outer membrane protein assembly factor BamB
MLGSAVLAQGAVSRVDLKSEIGGYPILYHGSLYGFTQNKVLSKINPQGQSEWTLDKYDVNAERCFVKFDRVFILSKEGQIISFNAKYGFRQWGTQRTGIKRVNIAYPYIYYTTKSGDFGCLDFHIGNVVWELKGRQVDQFYSSIENKEILVLTKKGEILHLDKFSGTISQKSKPSFTPELLIGGWRNKLILGSSEGLYEYELEKRRFKKLDASLKAGGKVFDQYYINLESSEDRWYSYDLNQQKFRWQKPLVGEQGALRFVFGSSKLLSISDDLIGNLYDFSTGEVFSKSFLISDVPAKDLLTFEEVGEKIVLIFRKAFFLVVPEELK